MVIVHGAECPGVSGRSHVGVVQGEGREGGARLRSGARRGVHRCARALSSGNNAWRGVRGRSQMGLGRASSARAYAGAPTWGMVHEAQCAIVRGRSGGGEQRGGQALSRGSGARRGCTGVRGEWSTARGSGAQRVRLVHGVHAWGVEQGAACTFLLEGLTTVIVTDSSHLSMVIIENSVSSRAEKTIASLPGPSFLHS